MRVIVSRPRLRLRTILLTVHLFVLIIPVACIYGFRLYENELVRETESELIAQGAYITALYKHVVLPTIPHLNSYGREITHPALRSPEKYSVIHPTLTLGTSAILPPRPPAAGTTSAPDPYSQKAGKMILPVIEEATLTTLAGVRVVDYQGVVVAGREEVGYSLMHVEEVADALTGRYAASLRVRHSDHPDPPLTSISRATRIRAFVAMPIIHENRVLGAMLLSRSPRNILKGLYDERHHLFMVGSIIITITILLALLTSYAIARPIYALIGQTQRISRGEQPITPINAVTQELALLSEHITSMSHTIAARSSYIHNFALHVSHEFKTPLTAISGAIELITEHGTTMPPAQFHKFLSNITQDTHRLKLLVSRLLELARADVMLPTNEQTEVRALLDTLKERYGETVIIIVAPQLPYILHIAHDVLETVMINLIDNGMQHGATEFHITMSKHHTQLHIDVKNNGEVISEHNQGRLFTPFFTTTREHGGTGLGLVISRSLLHAFKADIIYIPAKEGAHFRIIVENAAIES